MANHKSAIKRHRQSEVRQTRNRFWKSRVRTVTRTVEEASKKGDKKAALEALKAAMKEIGKAKKNGVLHANTASRKVARLSRLVSKVA